MDLDFTPEQELLRETVRGLCARHCGLDVVRQMENDPIGYPDKSIVSLRTSGAREVRQIPFEGDLRNQLPTGHEVEVTYQSNGGSNRVMALSYK